ncbi:hypothetical protein PHYSODRAFT_403175, partial [Phytophthora sojae]
LAFPSPKCTFNIASFVALFHLLCAADRLGVKGIHVAGDNDLMIRTLNTRTLPQAARLRGWFLKRRHMTDKVRVESWMQTSKAANQGSCSLATAAVESGQTLEPTP